MKDKEKNDVTVAEIVSEIRTIPWKVYNQEIEIDDDCGVSQHYCDTLSDRLEVAHDREIKALEWKIENYAKVVECKDREIKAKDAKIEELMAKWHEALNIADCVEKCASIEYQTEAMFKKNEVIAGLRKQIAELRECLNEASGLQLRCESCKVRHCDSICMLKLKWRNTLEGSDNEVE